jgi:hypothetical protein
VLDGNALRAGGFTLAYFSGSSVTMVIFTAPSARMLCGDLAATLWPSGRSPTCWPPVMATASL